MKKLDFLNNLVLNEKEQISSQLAPQFTPLYFDNGDDLEQRKKLITLQLNFFALIMKQGDLEHSGDWDPACTVILNNGTIIGDEPGYNVTSISGDNLLLEHPNDDGESPNEDEDCYYTIPIKDIATIQYYFH